MILQSSEVAMRQVCLYYRKVFIMLVTIFFITSKMEVEDEE